MPGYYDAATFTASGTHLVVGTGDAIEYWNVLTGEQEKQVPIPSQPEVIACSPNDEILVICTSLEVELWSLPEFKPLAAHRLIDGRGVIFDDLSTTAYCFGNTGWLVWPLDERSPSSVHQQRAYAVHPASGKLITKRDRHLEVADLDTDNTRTIALEDSHWLCDHVSFDPTGKWIAVSDDRRGTLLV